MDSVQKFDYYYGKKAEQFSFFRIPKLLVKDERFRDLSTDAKFLYGLMLDRMSLSQENGWLDTQNRVFIIYTMESIMKDLNCGKDKCVKMLAELDDKKGIGLIRRVKRGLGRPDIIYVMDFVSNESSDCEQVVANEDDDRTGENSTESRLLKNRNQDFLKTEAETSEKSQPVFLENRMQDFGNIAQNNTKINNTEINKSNPSNLSYEDDEIDSMELMATIDLIKDNLNYDEIMPSLPEDEQRLFKELFEVICDNVCIRCKVIKVGEKKYPYELVKAKFMKLNFMHLKYVIERMKKSTKKIEDIKSYMFTALYNSSSTIEHYYQQKVQSDMFAKS